MTAGEEAAGAAAAEDGEGSGDRTDDPEAAGAPGAVPTAEPSAASAEPGSEEPQPGAYLKAGDDIFIKLTWASSSRAPVEGETFDGEVLASAGLSLVDAPGSTVASLRRSSCCGSCCHSTAPGKPSWLPGKRLSRRRELTWRSVRRSSGAKIKKLSGPWRRSGSDSTRSTRPFFSRRPRLRRNKGWLPRSSPRRKVN